MWSLLFQLVVETKEKSDVYHVRNDCSEIDGKVFHDGDF